MFSFGFDLWIQFVVSNEGLTNLGIEFRFLAFNQLFFNVENAPYGFGISITALIFLAMLIKYEPESLTENNETMPPLPPTFEENDNV